MKASTPAGSTNLPPDLDCARRLVAAQFPQWASLPVSAVSPQGHDNRSFRLGPDMVLRLPSAALYAGQPQKEWTWLPRLTPHLPVPVPEPLALGEPGLGYPFYWIIHRWLSGAALNEPGGAALARDLAGFLVALHAAPAQGAPLAGDHNFHRGGNLRVYDLETRTAVAALPDHEQTQALALWDRACASQWDRPPVWVHGDLAPGNLLASSAGRLDAVIDFGSSAVGDPACDLVPAWTFLDAKGAATFRAALNLPQSCWHRAAGWALWKALITLRDGDQSARPVLDRLLGSP